MVGGSCFTLSCEAYSTEEVSTTLHWERQLGVDVLQNDRVTVLSDGTLLVSDAEVGVDSGTYSCVATNKYGSSRAFSLVTVVRKSVN